MKIRLWGTRGSIPSPGPSTARYGGNTSCVEVRLNDGSLLIIDGGSGIRPLGLALGSCTGTILLSHYHWDHIQGLPFFSSAFFPGSDIRLLGPPTDGRNPGDILEAQMQRPYFPAPFSACCGIREYDALDADEWLTLGTARISTCRLCHPGLTLAFRIDDGDHSFVYASDNEPNCAAPGLRRKLTDLAEGADLLLHDCQYEETEYPSRQGWGHSTPRQAVSIAQDAGVRQLLLFHHDPAHSDEQLEAMAEQACDLAPDIDVLIGREGETLQVGAPSTAVTGYPGT